MKKNFLPPLLLLIIFSSIAFAEELSSATPHKVTIAINDFDAQGITANEAMTLSNVLRSKLINTDKYQVMERGEMNTILKEQSFQQSGACNESGCIVEMGQILGIEQIIAGAIGKVGSAYSINARVISVSTGKIIKSVSHNYTGPIEGLLTTEMSIVANKLSGIESVFTEKGSGKKTRDKRKRKRNIILTTSLLTVTGGVAAVLIFTGDNNKNGSSSLEVSWE